MTNEQQEALRLLEVGVPQVIQVALHLERLLSRQRSLLSRRQWQEVLETWQEQMREQIAEGPDSSQSEVWEQMQAYLFPMLR